MNCSWEVSGFALEKSNAVSSELLLWFASVAVMNMTTASFKEESPLTQGYSPSSGEAGQGSRQEPGGRTHRGTLETHFSLGCKLANNDPETCY